MYKNRVYLKAWQEYTGKLVEVRDNVLVFESELFVYPMSEDFKKQSSELVGERVSVLLTDSDDTPYRIIKAL